jgi:hypothetical protein
MFRVNEVLELDRVTPSQVSIYVSGNITPFPAVQRCRRRAVDSRDILSLAAFHPPGARRILPQTDLQTPQFYRQISGKPLLGLPILC